MNEEPSVQPSGFKKLLSTVSFGLIGGSKKTPDALPNSSSQTTNTAEATPSPTPTPGASTVTPTTTPVATPPESSNPVSPSPAPDNSQQLPPQ